jgi:GNAT superfamily N-acetyltransferase
MNIFLMRLIQALEFIKFNGVFSFLHEICYCNRVAIVVEKNLIEFDASYKQPENISVKVIELRPDIINENNSYYLVKNRYLKAVHYLKKGYGGYAILKDEKIIGDIWFVPPNENNILSWHSDCKWLRITCAENQVYTFDMFLAPDERGNNLAYFLQSSALKALRQKGFTMAYGYYWVDNMPALWVHRLGKWKEINRLKVNRFLFFKKVLA